MKLTLDRADLKPEFETVNCSNLVYEHFKVAVQQAIRKVGRATFQEYDGSNYNAILVPTFKEKRTQSQEPQAKTEIPDHENYHAAPQRYCQENRQNVRRTHASQTK